MLSVALLFAAQPVAGQSTGSTADGPAGEDGECVVLDTYGPGLYATVHRDRIYIEGDGKRLELGLAESAFASEDELYCLERVPDFLNWPCLALTAEEKPFEEYGIEDLPDEGAVAEVVERFFDDNAIIAPSGDWLTGAYHIDARILELGGFPQPAWWYRVARERTPLERNVPETVLVALYNNEKQVVVDMEYLEALLERYPTMAMVPVYFLFNEPDVIPVSRLGPEATLKMVADEFFQNDIRVSAVPNVFAGDYHLLVTMSELEDLFEIPSEEEIGDVRLQELVEEIETYGFSRKALVVAMFKELGTVAVDEVEKIRAAITMGMTELPVVVFYYLADSHLETCRTEDIRLGIQPQASGTTLSRPSAPVTNTASEE